MIILFGRIRDGIDSLKWFDERSIVSSFVRLTMECGIFPEKLLDERSKLCSCLRLPIELGIEP